MKIQVDQILPNPDQPRTLFDEDELAGLAQSIKKSGLINPIVVEEAGDQYILIDGERRWRAHKLAELKTIEATVRPASNHKGLDRLTHALVANVQRSAMGYVDEAKAYEKLVAKLGSVEKVAEQTGMGNSVIYSRLYLLELSPRAQELYNLKKLPFDLSLIGLLKRMEPAMQDHLVSMAVTRGWKTTSILRAGTNLMKGGRKNKKQTLTPGPKPKEEPEFKGKFDALVMVDKKLPAEIKTAARETCKACPLYQDASPKECRQCPLPDFLNRLEVA